MSGAHLFIHKGYGLARAVFNRRHMEALRGCAGVGHVRYPTSGGARAASEIPALLCEPALRDDAGA